jgi:hypothetical protein
MPNYVYKFITLIEESSVFMAAERMGGLELSSERRPYSIQSSTARQSSPCMPTYVTKEHLGHRRGPGGSPLPRIILAQLKNILENCGNKTYHGYRVFGG